MSNQSEDLEISLQRAKRIAHKNGINYVSADLLCYEIIQSGVAEGRFMDEADITKWRTDEVELFKVSPKIKLGRAGVVLTKDASALIRLAKAYQAQLNEQALTCYHYLLAVFSVNIPATQNFKRRGWVFANYAEELINRGMVKKPCVDLIKADTSHIAEVQKAPLYLTFSSRKRNKYLAKANLEAAIRLSSFKDDKRAHNAASNVLGYDETSEDGYVYKALYEIILSDVAGAINTLEAARSKAIDSKQTKLLLSYAQMLAGEYDTAVQIVGELLAKYPDDLYLLNNMGFTKSKMGLFADAIEYLDKALAIDTNYAFSLNNKGYAIYKLGNPEEGKELINRSLTIDKGNSYAYRNLAFIAMEAGEVQVAKSMAQKVQLFGYREDFGNDLDELL